MHVVMVKEPAIAWASSLEMDKPKQSGIIIKAQGDDVQ